MTLVYVCVYESLYPGLPKFRTLNHDLYEFEKRAWYIYGVGSSCHKFEDFCNFCQRFETLNAILLVLFLKSQLILCFLVNFRSNRNMIQRFFFQKSKRRLSDINNDIISHFPNSTILGRNCPIYPFLIYLMPEITNIAVGAQFTHKTSHPRNASMM